MNINVFLTAIILTLLTTTSLAYPYKWDDYDAVAYIEIVAEEVQDCRWFVEGKVKYSSGCEFVKRFIDVAGDEYSKHRSFEKWVYKNRYDIDPMVSENIQVRLRQLSRDLKALEKYIAGIK